MTEHAESLNDRIARASEEPAKLTYTEAREAAKQTAVDAENRREDLAAHEAAQYADESLEIAELSMAAFNEALAQVEAIEEPAGETKPRVWNAGDPMPDDVFKVRDSMGDVWTRERVLDAPDVWMTPETVAMTWERIAKKYAPLIEVERQADSEAQR